MTETVLVGLIGLAGTVSAGLLGSLVPGSTKAKTDRSQQIFDSYDELVSQLRGICKDQQEQIDTLIEQLEDCRRKLSVALQRDEDLERDLRRLKYLHPDDTL